MLTDNTSENGYRNYLIMSSVADSKIAEICF